LLRSVRPRTRVRQCCWPPPGFPPFVALPSANVHLLLCDGRRILSTKGRGPVHAFRMRRGCASADAQVYLGRSSGSGHPRSTVALGPPFQKARTWVDGTRSGPVETIGSSTMKVSVAG